MNTISEPPPPPPMKQLPRGKRFVGVFLGVVGGGLMNAWFAHTAFEFWTRKTSFLPYDPSADDFKTATFTKHNPASNPPICVDHAVRTVPLKDLKTKDQARLTTEFCRGVWSGTGYWYQRRYMEKKYRGLKGREDQLWDRKDLATSEYPVGTKITDHFEVVEHTPEKVVVRCGDSPLNQDVRPSDGLFAMEVTKDEEAQTATFHLKSVFVNTTADGKNMEPLPWHFQYAHRMYTKLWMETALMRVTR